MRDNAVTLDYKSSWYELASLAVQGLHSAYGRDRGRLPHSVICSGSKTAPVGFSVRYALISLLGLARSQSLGFDNEDFIRDIWLRVKLNRGAIEKSVGDLGLVLWAQALTGRDGLFSASEALQVFRKQRGSLDSINLAWVMLGTDHALMNEADTAAEELVELAKEDLLQLFNPKSALFYRHMNQDFFASVSRRVPCFANQIYPVMALAVHARRTGCAEAARVGRAVAENLCRLQGPLGQWWWLYDANSGAVVNGYPVFSVHQDGMAPMALLESTRAGGRSYQFEIDSGVSWIHGGNELKTNLVLADHGLILRNIHQKSVGRVRRALHSAAWCWGLRGKESGAHEPAKYTVRSECRPYHLGWILYAVSLMSTAAGGQIPQAQPMEGCRQCR